MYTLDELIVKPGDPIGDLIEDRARLFYSKCQGEPTVAFISIDVWQELFAQAARNNRHSYANPQIPQKQGIRDVSFQTAFGLVKLKVMPGVKSFMMIGLDSSYADYDFYYGIPKDLYAEASKKEMNEEFEKIVLETK